MINQDNRRAHIISILKKNKALIEEAIQCPICLDVMRLPTRIPDCTHVFCKNCLINTQKAGWRGCDICIDSGSFDRDATTCYHHFRCPVCRKVLAYQKNQLEAFKVDIVLNHIISFWNKYNEINMKSDDRITRFIQRSADELMKMVYILLKNVDNGYHIVNDVEEIIRKLDFIKRHAFEYDVIEIETVLLKAIHKIILMATKITKDQWKQYERRYQQYAKQHESRPANVNLQSDDNEFSSPMGALSSILRMLQSSHSRPYPRGLSSMSFSELHGRPFLFIGLNTEDDWFSSVQESLDTFTAIATSLFDF